MARKAAEAFDNADVDGNGFLSIEEIRTVAERAGFNEKQIQNMVQKYDTSGDGKVSKDEFVGAAKVQTFIGVCKSFDVNGDGTITREELEKVMEEVNKKDYTEDDMDRLMRMVDTDQSGQISYVELANHLSS